MLSSYQNFRLVPTLKLLGTMLRDRCLATTFHTITDGDADGRCLELSGVISPSEVTTHHNAVEGKGQLFDSRAQ
jgi:hypothetical protein